MQKGRAMAARKSSKGNGSTKKNGAEQHGANGIELLKGKHKEIRSLIDQLTDFQQSDESMKSLKRACSLWLDHANLEQQIAYPAFRESGIDIGTLDEVQVESDLIIVLIDNLMQRSTNDDVFEPMAKVTLRAIARLMEMEESEPDGLFAKALKAGVDVKALGERLQNETEHRAEEDRPACSAPRGPESKQPRRHARVAAQDRRRRSEILLCRHHHSDPRPRHV